MKISHKLSTRVVSVTLSFSLLAAVYFFIDWTDLVVAWQAVDILWLSAALLVAFPLVALTVVRLQWLSPTKVSFKLGFYVNLQASAINLLAPSKLGDIGKAVFLAKHTKAPAQSWVILCLFEKILDLTSLFAWCSVGLWLMPGLSSQFRWLGIAVAALSAMLYLCLLFPPLPEKIAAVIRPFLPAVLQRMLDKLSTEWAQIQKLLYKDKRKVLGVVILSFLIWAGHFAQLYVLAMAAQAVMPLAVLFGLVPLALVIGLLPLTFAGIGTRDAAFVVFIGPYITAPVAAVLGMLATFRYILPALGGIPLIGRDIVNVKKG